MKITLRMCLPALVSLLLAVMACGGTATPKPTTPSPSPTPTPSPSPSPIPTPSPSPSPSTTSGFLYFDAFPSGNLYGYRIDYSDGKLTPLSANPFKVNTGSGTNQTCTVGCDRMLLADPLGKFLLYADNEPGGTSGLVSFVVDANTGALTQADLRPPATRQISIDPEGRFIYGQGGNGQQNQLNGFSLNRDTGLLTPTAGSPYLFPGGTSYGPPGVTNAFVYAMTYCPDQPAGCTQKSLLNGWAIEQTTGALTPLSSSPTGGPTTLMIGQTVTPNGQFLYTEQTYADTGGTVRYAIIGYRINGDGSLTALPFPPQQTGDVGGANQLLMSPNGNFLYDVIATHIRAYAIDGGSGALSLTNVYDIPNAGWVAIDPTVKYAYISANGIQAYTVNPTSGALSPISGASVSVPEVPSTMVIVKPQ